MTEDHPEQPGRVPVGELRELVEVWEDKVECYEPIEARWTEGIQRDYTDCANDLEAVIERYE